jgi:hypothetical protein
MKIITYVLFTTVLLFLDQKSKAQKLFDTNKTYSKNDLVNLINQNFRLFPTEKDTPSYSDKSLQFILAEISKLKGIEILHYYNNNECYWQTTPFDSVLEALDLKIENATRFINRPSYYSFSPLTTDAKLVNIYNQLIKIKNSADINENERKLIIPISRLRPSKEKTALRFLYADKFLSDAHYSDAEIATNVESAIRDADSIIMLNKTRLYEIGIVYEYIGDFYYTHGFDFEAVKAYHASIQNISEDKNTENVFKQFSIAKVYEKISTLYRGKTVWEYWEKANSYLSLAAESYLNGKDSIRACNAYMRKVTNYAWLINNQLSRKILIPYQYNNHAIRMMMLNTLISSWYKNYNRRAAVKFATINGAGLYYIGTILEVEGYTNQALLCYKQSLSYFLDDFDDRFFLSVMYSIADTYCHLGKATEALAWINRAGVVTARYKAPFEHSIFLYNKAHVFNLLKKHDSAIVYLEKVQTALNADAYRSDVMNTEILKSITQEYEISAKLIGSSDTTEMKLLYYRESDQEFRLLYKLTNQDAISSLDVLSHSANKMVALQILNKQILQTNDSILLKHKQDSLLIEKSNRKTAELITLQSKYSENVAKSKQNLAEKNLVVEKQKAEINLYYFSIGSIISIGLLLAALVIIRLRFLEANRLSRAKIVHNLSSDFPILQTLIANADNRIKQISDAYAEYLSIFNANWSEHQVSVQDELDLLDAYRIIQGYYKPIEVRYNIDDAIKSAKFIPSVFDVLLNNSVHRGCIEKDTCIFTIRVYKKNKHLICEVIDNGIPPLNDKKYLAHKRKSGLKLLRSRIRWLQPIHKRLFFKGYFTINALPDSSGTFVKLTIPYAKVKGADRRRQ